MRNAEIQRNAMGRGKNLALSEDTSLEKGKSAVKGDPKKSRSWIKGNREVQKEDEGLEVSLMGIHQK